MPAHDATQALQRWALPLVLMAATMLNYLDRQTLSILAPFIQRDLRLDNEALGWLFSAFYYSYTLAQFGVGTLLDRAHLRWAYGLAVVAWSLAAGLTGAATSFATLLLFRIMLGLAESANWPGAMRIIARALPPQDRPLANGIFTSGTSIGALIAPALVLALAARSGWRWTFVWVASLGLLWFAGWLPFSAHSALSGIWRSCERRATPAGAYRELLRSPQFWRVFFVTITVNPCLYFSVNWLPTYFVQERHVSPGSQLALLLTASYLGLGAGNWSCGLACRALVGRGWILSKARRAVFFSASALLALSALVPLVPGVTLTGWLLVAVNLGIGMWIAMYLTLAQEVSPDHVATAAGLLGGAGSLVGALAMWVVGRLTRVMRSFTLPLVGVAGLGVLASVAGLLATRRTPAIRGNNRAG